MANHVLPITVSPAEQVELERLQRAPSTPAGLSRRARAVLLMAHGVSGVEIAKRIGYTVVQVSRIRRRYVDGGVAGLHDRPKSGRPPTITTRKRAQIVALTLRPPGGGVTHWTTRDLARTAGVSHSTVHRLWQAHALKPHQVQTFKFTTDPAAEAKIYDVVGLYLHPPTNAVVLSLDEKTQIQALSRTQPLLPLRPGLPARQTHDYRRNGLTSLYAALEVASGKVVGECRARHTGADFLAFLNRLARTLSPPRGARDSRQLVDAHHAGRAGVGRAASARPLSFHADGRVLAQYGRGMVQHSDAQVGPPRIVRHRPRPHPSYRALPRGVECAPDALYVDQRAGGHYPEGPAAPVRR